MQVLYYGKTGFGTNDWICMQLKEVCYFCHSPKFGPGRSMLIGRLCYYRGCQYRGSTVICSQSHTIVGIQLSRKIFSFRNIYDYV